jgi:iron complex transport system ATP-binding protein
MSEFSIQNVSHHFGYFPVLQNISFEIEKGELFGIIGPNGSGKSTLIRAMSGLFAPQDGKILLGDRSLNQYSKKQLAQHIAVLEQEGPAPLPFTVEQIVTMGRYPWLKPLADLKEHDHQVIENVLKNLNLWDKRFQKVSTLSGGQRQLVSLARAMVQEPDILILDEPTTYLDIGHQILVMDHVRNWHSNNKLSVIMVLHDLNLAGQYCQKLLLLDQGQVKAWGTTEEVLEEHTLTQVYKTNLIKIEHPTLGVPQFLLISK